MIYLFLGPPAAGKGTQARLVAQATHTPFVSIGDCLRAQSQTNPHVAAYVNSGRIVPQSFITPLFRELHQRYGDNVVLDGALRSVEQAHDVLLLWQNAKRVVVWLEVPDETIRQRIIERHRENAQARRDDTLTIADERIALYRQSLPTIVKEIGHHHIPIISINGDGTIDEIHAQIMKGLSQL